MANAFHVVCNADIFLYIQRFIKGEEGFIHNFRREFTEKLSISTLIEEALLARNWIVVERLYRKYMESPKMYILSNWIVNVYDLSYPHEAYSLMSTCEWLDRKMGKKFMNWVDYMDTAAGLGDLELVKYMHTHRPEGCTYAAMDLAARYGHLDVIEFLHENRMEGCSQLAMEWASLYGQLEVVQYLHRNRSEECSPQAMDYAAKNGHLEVIKFLHENRSEGCTEWALNYATKNGDLKMVKFLCENRTEGCLQRAIKWATRKGHSDIAEYLHAKRADSLLRNSMRYSIS